MTWPVARPAVIVVVCALLTACGAVSQGEPPPGAASVNSSPAHPLETPMTAIPVPVPVQLALDAANDGDTEAFLDTFTADGAVDDWGRVFRGREAIRGWSDKEFIGVRVTLAVTGVRQSGNRVTVSATVGGDGFNGPSDFTFVMAEDGLSLMRITG
ncbi:nuclear transport factor 2 family protein [Streptomyces sp. AK02-01A]|uniref:nuclear transport factor 2 family protein n=1 Tax=Streptomyces sp. AK02-01A TaxID=3028648 RepID=UPI0029BF8019|nr:nuclear transport factor 2 family protein [Streptomyces sp. AK02-01A]MDX3853345.1 nuclear transport factor 2 family protein [Streptomyces sp. AK02-01A]